MESILKMIFAMVSGVFAGVALLFIMVVSSIGYTYVTTDSVNLPGIVHAWFAIENGLPALNFNPNFTGMAVFIGFVIVAFCFATWYRLKKTA